MKVRPEPIGPDVSNMLTKIPGNQDNKFVKTIEVTDLSMRTNKKTVDNLNEPELLQELDRSPESRLTATSSSRLARVSIPGGPGRRDRTVTSFLGNMGLFRIDSAVISPKPKEPLGDLGLAGTETKDNSQTVGDIIKLLEKEAR